MWASRTSDLRNCVVMHAVAGDLRRRVQARVRIEQVNLQSCSDISALAPDDVVPATRGD
jgi:hypothetical protein